MKELLMKRCRTLYLLSTIFCLSFLICNFSSCSNAQTEENLPTDCVICPQFVPECGQNEVLIPQTCEKCSHCESFTPPETESTPQPEIIDIIPEPTPASEKAVNCQSCQFHAQCPAGSKCVNDCCELKPRKERKYTNIKKPVQEIEKTPIQKPVQKKPEPVKKEAVINKLKVKKTPDKICKMLCGTKCCKQGESCITLSQCKGKKKCHLPLLRICTKKKPEPLSGGAVSF